MERQPTNDKRSLNSIRFINESEGWAAGRGYTDDSPDGFAVLLRTIDGGRNWSEVETNIKERFFERVLFHDPAHG